MLQMNTVVSELLYGAEFVGCQNETVTIFFNFAFAENLCVIYLISVAAHLNPEQF